MILESVKQFLRTPSEVLKDDTTEISKKNVISDLTYSDTYPNTGAFFDSDGTNGYFNDNDKTSKLEKQKNKIMRYRQLAKTPDVSDGIEEIVNEIIFTFKDENPVVLDINEENDKIKDTITEKFNKIMKLMNIKRNFYSIVKNSYIDGQINIHCAYNKNSKDGIKSVKYVEPVYLYFDGKSDSFKYFEKENYNFFGRTNIKKDESYPIEEMIREDFGLYEDGINLSYLDYALKSANQLRTLEDLLIPMRFSRSISRRVFNVDIGDLPGKKGEQVMTEYQGKFKYRKFYNVQTGEISNQQHVTSMVEDYWFANRSGGKGTTVDTLDETGNLGELGDILYFNKKLYKSMFIPSNRISIDENADNSFDFDSTQVSKEDIKFFFFISRLRKVYTSLFKELLKREVISTQVMSEKEWDDYEEKINISFVGENTFVESMNLNIFTKKLDIYATAQDYAGKLFPIEKILKDVFKFTDEDIKENFELIAKEEKDPNYKKFYQTDEDM